MQEHYGRALSLVYIMHLVSVWGLVPLAVEREQIVRNPTRAVRASRRSVS